MTERYRCCAECKGSSPFFFCRDTECLFCHIQQMRKSAGNYTALTHRDTTANTAIKNIMRGNK